MAEKITRLGIVRDKDFMFYVKHGAVGSQRRPKPRSFRLRAPMKRMFGILALSAILPLAAFAQRKPAAAPPPVPAAKPDADAPAEKRAAAEPVAAAGKGGAAKPDEICAAQCNASRKIKCTATDPQYKKEKFRTLAGPDKGIDDCVRSCKTDRARMNKDCLAKDTALRRQYIATVRCFPDGKIGSSECANATTDLMNCVMNQPRQ